MTAVWVIKRRQRTPGIVTQFYTYPEAFMSRKGALANLRQKAEYDQKHIGYNLTKEESNATTLEKEGTERKYYLQMFTLRD